MNKNELYTSFVDHHKKFAQGTPRWVAEQLDNMDELNELIDEKMVTVTHIPSKSGMLPDEYWIVPTGCYNLWTENNPMMYLTFVRKFMNIPEEGIFAEMKIDDVGYQKWLDKNIDDLTNILTMDNNYMTNYYKVHNTLPLINTSNLNEKQMEYISTFKFTEAKKEGVVDIKISHLKDLLVNRISITNQLISKYVEIIRLLSGDAKQEYQTSLDKYQMEYQMESDILKKIKDLDMNKLLSDINN